MEDVFPSGCGRVELSLQVLMCDEIAQPNR